MYNKPWEIAARLRELAESYNGLDKDIVDMAAHLLDNFYDTPESAIPLKPCPFCGGKVNQYKTSIFLCTKCPALMNFPICSTYNHARRLFNERWHKDRDS